MAKLWKGGEFIGQDGLIKKQVDGFQCPARMLVQSWGFRKPNMGDAWSDKDQVTRVELLYRVAYDPSSRALSNKAKFKFLVVMPSALINVVLEDSDVVGFIRIKFDLLKQFLHCGLILFKIKKIIKIAL